MYFSVGLGKKCFHILTFVIALMPDLDKGQHGRVPIVLERAFADVQYSADVPVVQQVGDFGFRAKMFSHAKSQFFDALFQFLPSGGVDGCKSHINIVLIVVIFSF
ncbi:hypothetical protein HR10_01275 [Porphyromonas gulae]|nr:hypothetical protein HR10_01275 [Porphyromonas gulae]